MITVYVSVYMKRNRLWLRDFLTSGSRKERMKKNNKVFSYETLTSYEKLILSVGEFWIKLKSG